MSNEDLKKLAVEADAALQQNDLDLVEKIGNRITKKNRSAGLAYLGIVNLRREKYENAEKLLLESYQLNEKQNLALANLIPVYLKLRDYKNACAFGEKAYKCMPKNISVAINYSAGLLHEQRYKECVDILSKFWNDEIPNLSILTGLISAHRALFDKNEAERLLRIAEKEFPGRPEVTRLKADTIAERNPEEALQAFRQSLLNDPNNIATRWNMSLVELRLGMFKDGWLNYDNGLLPEVGKIGRPLPKLFRDAQRHTTTDSLDVNKWTFLASEQGIGDQILFLNCLSDFVNDYPKSILIAEKRMHPILQRSFPNTPIYQYGIGPVIASNRRLCNGIFPIGSIQKYYRNTKEEFLASRKPYIVPDSNKINSFRASLEKKSQGRQIVGFSWKGGFWERAQKTKTLELDLWSPVFENENVMFVSLQYGNTDQERALLSKKFKNLVWIEGVDFKKDLDGWLAIAGACDRIVSVSTALVHFAGAAGMSVDLLLSDRGAPFIWGLEGTESIVYPKVTIHRKSPEQDYTHYFHEIANLLRN